jgi:hypothetical protein
MTVKSVWHMHISGGKEVLLRETPSGKGFVYRGPYGQWVFGVELPDKTRTMGTRTSPKDAIRAADKLISLRI